MSEYGLRQQDYETIKALKQELADLRARLEKAERDAERFNTLINLPPIEAQAIFWNASSRTERTKMIDAIAKERT